MLDISWSLVLISGSTFLIMLLILNTILYKPMIAFIDNRDNSLDSNKDAIKACEKSIISNNNLYDEIIKNAGIEAEKLIHSKQQKAMSSADVKIQSHQEELNSQYEVFLKELDIAKEALKKSISSNADDLAKSINNKLISL